MSHCEKNHHDENHVHNECACCCSHCHEDAENSPNFKTARLVIGFILFAVGFAVGGKIQIIFFLLSYLVSGYDILLNAVKNIFKGKLFDENFLMALASIGALCLKDFAEAPAVMLFYQLGETLQDYAFERSENSIRRIMDIRPELAYISKNGKRYETDAAKINVGDIIIVSPGERIPLDGIVVGGTSYIDTSCITGESVKRKFTVGDEVLSGCVNVDGVLEIEVIRLLADSAASRIVDLMKNSLEKKSHSEKFITKFAKIYTPTVVFLAILTAVVPPLADGLDFAKWVGRALTFLVISCPCALVLSIPLGFFVGLGAAGKKGIIIKGGNAIEKLSKTSTVVFDKTGTLTKGVFEVSSLQTHIDEKEFLKILAYAEYYSNHPIAAAIKQKFTEETDTSEISDYKEIAGKGISVNLFGKNFLVGNGKLMEDFGICITDTSDDGTAVYVACENEYVGCAVVSDEIRDLSVVKKLSEQNIETVMLTGDRKTVAEAVGAKLGISKIKSELLPEDKVREVQKMSENSVCAFVGDGINDAPSLAEADVGIAMGGIGSDAAVEAADVVLINDDISKIISAIALSKRTMKIVKENIVFSLGIKIVVMILGFFGIASMPLAIFADVGVALIAILNSCRGGL